METRFVKMGNAFYEIDEECFRKQTREYERMEMKKKKKQADGEGRKEGDIQTTGEDETERAGRYSSKKQ